ncbi:MAG: cation diffusion facilitator family transporter [Candidatus Dormibacteraeota bacterium]|uniref:Cation diffusion facilitator family transporter n=1 Tax=Candidatus Dormiibacter inghamiae TaxID=3127013 RepID=A0A934N7N1_9BACT|nr:cation diffusion facilitator family transporter [Candidatus Dormibacteraeota bacterium]MBJ7606313.1 cation diffusion facilitator family transporter [Candidatus Dormibacteraeota bacterium]
MVTSSRAAEAAPRPRLTAQRIAFASLIIDCCLVIAKLTAGLLTGSLGLLGEAAHSALDLLASLFALLAVRTSRRPADHEHPYGHGRAENLAAFGEGLILLLTAAVIAFEAVRRLVGAPVHVDPALYAIVLVAATMLLEIGRATTLRWASRRWHSPALAAAAQNRFADIFSSAGVLAGLVGVRLGFGWADAGAGLLVAAVIGRSAGLLAWRSADILMDRAPKGVEESVREAIEAVEGVRAVRGVRVRRSGGRLQGDARVTARPTLSIEAAQGLSERVKTAARQAEPELDLDLVLESQWKEGNLVERVHAVAARQGAVNDLHNVTVEREANGSIHLSMHAKLPGAMTLEKATATTSALEQSLKLALPEVARVDVHLEPLEPDWVSGSDVTASRADLVKRIRVVTLAQPHVLDCLDVELSSRGQRLVAHVVARLPASLALEEAHRIETELELALRRELPELSEVVARVSP